MQLFKETLLKAKDLADLAKEREKVKKQITLINTLGMASISLLFRL